MEFDKRPTRPLPFRPQKNSENVFDGNLSGKVLPPRKPLENSKSLPPKPALPPKPQKIKVPPKVLPKLPPKPEKATSEQKSFEPKIVLEQDLPTPPRPPRPEPKIILKQEGKTPSLPKRPEKVEELNITTKLVQPSKPPLPPHLAFKKPLPPKPNQEKTSEEVAKQNLVEQLKTEQKNQFKNKQIELPKRPEQPKVEVKPDIEISKTPEQKLVLEDDLPNQIPNLKEEQKTTLPPKPKIRVKKRPPKPVERQQISKQQEALQNLEKNAELEKHVEQKQVGLPQKPEKPIIQNQNPEFQEDKSIKVEKNFEVEKDEQQVEKVFVQPPIPPKPDLPKQIESKTEQEDKQEFFELNNQELSSKIPPKPPIKPLPEKPQTDEFEKVELLQKSFEQTISPKQEHIQEKDVQDGVVLNQGVEKEETKEDRELRINKKVQEELMSVFAQYNRKVRRTKLIFAILLSILIGALFYFVLTLPIEEIIVKI